MKQESSDLSFLTENDVTNALKIIMLYTLYVISIVNKQEDPLESRYCRWYPKYNAMSRLYRVTQLTHISKLSELQVVFLQYTFIHWCRLKKNIAPIGTSD